MSPPSTSVSDSSSLSSRVLKLPYQKSSIQINLNHHYKSKVYTNGDPLAGEVSITAPRDVRFDALHILLVGTTKTRVEGINSPQESTHTFLKLAMPIPESTYPVPRVFEAGRTYTIPFNFVIPNYLTINACNHDVESDLVREHHTRLPPSMGDGIWERDDMAPEMARVEYVVKARVIWDGTSGSASSLAAGTTRLMEARHVVRVLPAYSEDAPLSITKADTEYCMTKAKSLRKALFSGKGKLGKLTATAVQPSAVVLRSDGNGASGVLVQVDLRFEPTTAEVLPPRITAVSGKILARTYYSSGIITGFPNHGDWCRSLAVDRRGAYATSVALASSAAPERVWSQKLTAAARRDSGYSSSTSRASDSDERPDELSDRDQEGQQQQQGRRGSRSLLASCGKATAKTNKVLRGKEESPVYHTAMLQIPVSIPASKKVFIPTFHSCIASRTYSLQLSVTVAGAGVGSSSASSWSATVTLNVPLQVVADAGPGQTSTDGLAPPSFETAVEEAQADDFLRPRVMSVPDVQLRERSELPGYQRR